jgi:cell wall-associated NlpC family hydrolase
MSSRIPEWAAKYISIPYEKKNCWELVESIFNAEFGISIGPVEDQRGHLRARDWIDVIYEDLGVREGDVVLFRSSVVSRHVGVVLNQDLMIHSIKGANSCIEKWKGPLWDNRLESVYRHKSCKN